MSLVVLLCTGIQPVNLLNGDHVGPLGFDKNGSGGLVNGRHGIDDQRRDDTDDRGEADNGPFFSVYDVPVMAKVYVPFPKFRFLRSHRLEISSFIH